MSTESPSADGASPGGDDSTDANDHDEAATERVFDWTRFSVTAEGPATYHRKVDDCEAGGGAVMQVAETLTIERAVQSQRDFEALVQSRSTHPHGPDVDPVVAHLFEGLDRHALVGDGSDWSVTVEGGVADWLALYETIETMGQYSRADVDTDQFASKAEYQYLSQATGASLLNNVLQRGAVGPNCAIALVAIHTDSANPGKVDEYLAAVREAVVEDDEDE